MALSRIGNIMIGTTDLTRSVTFYHDTLGLPVQSTSAEFAFLDAGSVTIGLSTPHAKLSDPLPGATEVVFAVDGVREAHEELSKRGVQFFNEPRNVTGDQWAANFVDPDGHLLSIFGPECKPSGPMPDSLQPGTDSEPRQHHKSWAMLLRSSASR